MAAADVGLPGMVIVFTITWYVGTGNVLNLLGVSSSLPFKWTQKKNNATVSSRRGRVQHVMWWYFVCSGDAVCFRVPMESLTVLVPLQAFKVCNRNLDTPCN